MAGANIRYFACYSHQATTNGRWAKCRDLGINCGSRVFQRYIAVMSPLDCALDDDLHSPIVSPASRTGFVSGQPISPPNDIPTHKNIGHAGITSSVLAEFPVFSRLFHLLVRKDSNFDSPVLLPTGRRFV